MTIQSGDTGTERSPDVVRNEALEEAAAAIEMLYPSAETDDAQLKLINATLNTVIKRAAAKIRSMRTAIEPDHASPYGNSTREIFKRRSEAFLAVHNVAPGGYCVHRVSLQSKCEQCECETKDNE